MLQSMRDKAKSWVTFVVVGIIAFMMAITGLETLAPNPNNPNVATVNGEDITRAQLTQSLEQQRRMLIQQMGDQFDPSLIDEKQLRESVLQSLIDRSLLLQEAKNGGMGLGQKELDAMIVRMPEFQQDGKFDQDRFMMMVRSLGMSPAQFRVLLSDETVLQQIQAGVAGSEFVTQSEINRLTALESQKRAIAWLTLDVAKVRDSIEPTEDQIKSYYEAHRDQYMTPEQVEISFVEMGRASLVDDLEVDEQAVKDEYQRRLQDIEENAADTQTVSTILIQTGDQRSLEEARKIAAEVESRLKAGEAFAKLAEEYSDDPVTSAKGGDMGQVQPGIFGDTFDETVASLEPGQVSKPVETDFGVQIIKLTSREKPVIPSFDELKNEIAIGLKTQEAETIYLDKTRKLADISFEASDLAQPAEQLGLTIQTAGPFTRQGGSTDVTSNAKVIAAAFSDDVLELGANSELIELSPEKAMVLRVKKHLKPELRPMAEVQDSIVQALKIEEAREQLVNRAEALQAKLVAGDTVKQVAESEGLNWTEVKTIARREQGVPQPLLTESFKMPHPVDGKSSYASVELSNGDIAVVALSKVIEGKPIEADTASNRMMASYIANGNGRNLFTEYLKSLKETAKVKITKEEE
ncbi:SurA N-terminal domain-containing protein [Endozoicomonas sp. 8E]|uniref:SurA N-terminal domain-containing protein n=1 Tax=Endozoicomonas sp. 8E TaxID=3035692 RepID=UPI0029394F83|nr:SurA N-terminal domain-containing protein [Endozoicomonas sp. 8E]WOG30163.1 SurA N-terminal domain-containing protein [Endozoicomonas sp. 8E]